MEERPPPPSLPHQIPQFNPLWLSLLSLTRTQTERTSPLSGNMTSEEQIGMVTSRSSLSWFRGHYFHINDACFQNPRVTLQIFHQLKHARPLKMPTLIWIIQTAQGAHSWNNTRIAFVENTYILWSYIQWELLWTTCIHTLELKWSVFFLSRKQGSHKFKGKVTLSVRGLSNCFIPGLKNPTWIYLCYVTKMLTLEAIRERHLMMAIRENSAGTNWCRFLCTPELASPLFSLYTAMASTLASSSRL